MKTIAQQLNIKEFPFNIKDSEGNILYCEYSNNYWYKCEYDIQDNVIYYKNSNNYWYKREFDSQGNFIYYENSKGKIEDNRTKEIIEVNGVKYKRI